MSIVDSAKLVGSPGIRLATIVLVLVGLGGVALYRREPSSLVFWPTIVVGLLALIALIHCFRRLYAQWMRFAAVLHKVALTVLFGACYLLVVPVFHLIVRLLDPLRLRRKPEADTFWVERRRPDVDPVSLRRMG